MQNCTESLNAELEKSKVKEQEIAIEGADFRDGSYKLAYEGYRYNTSTVVFRLEKRVAASEERGQGGKNQSYLLELSLKQYIGLSQDDLQKT